MNRYGKCLKSLVKVPFAKFPNDFKYLPYKIFLDFPPELWYDVIVIEDNLTR